MSEIPEDIREIAEKTWQPTSFECKQAIAHAILAERKRCADIAKLARNNAEFYGNPEMRRAASLIAHRIEAA